MSADSRLLYWTDKRTGLTYVWDGSGSMYYSGPPDGAMVFNSPDKAMDYCDSRRDEYFEYGIQKLGDAEIQQAIEEEIRYQREQVKKIGNEILDGREKYHQMLDEAMSDTKEGDCIGVTFLGLLMRELFEKRDSLEVENKKLKAENKKLIELVDGAYEIVEIYNSGASEYNNKWKREWLQKAKDLGIVPVPF